jgi:hypothetical protein
VILVKLGRNRGSELPIPISAAGNILSELPLPTSKTGIGVQAKIFSPKTGGIPVKITKFDTNHLRNDAHFQFQTVFRDLIAIHDAEALVKERYAEGASKTNVVMKEARKAIDAAFKQICDIINVYMVLEGEAAYEGFVRTLNEVVGRYRRKQHHHHHNHGLNPDTPD